MRWGWTLLLAASPLVAGAGDLEEFRVKRQAVFEFARKPQVSREGDRVTIEFATKGRCDVTVAIEDADGRIVRHLACGVLGDSAPPPFRRGSLRQRLTWDGKDDQGRYVDDKDRLRVRVSLGLKPRFERTLFWSPKKRLHQGAARWGFVGTQAGLPTPRIAAAPEGVYVFEGRGMDHLRLFDHQGEYLRTIYPPPAGKLKSIVGLAWHTFPQGDTLPLKHDILQSSFLTSGPSGMVEKVASMFGSAATALAVRRGRIALVHRRLNRLHADGSSGGLPLTGPETCYHVELRLDGIQQRHWWVGPTSAAFSPDGKRLYCTGFMWRQGRHSFRILKDCFHGVVCLDYESDDPPRVFAGSMKVHDSGTKEGQFRDATSVACDARGRVYVSDYMNDRIQVFAPDGTHLKNIPAFKPARVQVHHRTGEIYVFSWIYDHYATFAHDEARRKEAFQKPLEVPPKLTRLGPFEDPRPRATYDLPLRLGSRCLNRGRIWGGLEVTAELDSWTDPPTIWIVPGLPVKGEQQGEVPYIGGATEVTWEQAGIKLYAEKDGKLQLLRDFGREAKEAVLRLVPPMFARQRLYVNPKTGLLYVAEGQTTHYKAFKDVLEIDPTTGKIREVSLPFDAEDMAFDTDGRVYLRSHDLLVRYQMDRWREIPFDYGEQHSRVGTSLSRDTRRTDVASGLPLYNGTGWHKGGIYVNVKGDIIASCYVTKGDRVPPLAKRTDEKQVEAYTGKEYTPRMYPGRLRFGEMHIWDKHGQLLHEDAVGGLVDAYGVGIDRDRNVYLLAAPTRVLDGKRYFNRLTGTLMKVRPGRGRIISQNSHLIPFAVSDGTAPGRPHDLVKGSSPAWVEGIEWMYGGVGYCGKNAVREGGHCACYNSRFTLDYFARSFAPEVRRFAVAVLDSAGNLIMRIGSYGNVDDEGIGLMHGAYVATHTDRRLFIADPGNARIVSVALEYHRSQSVPMTDASDAAGR